MPTYASPSSIRDHFSVLLPPGKLHRDLQAFWGADPQYYLPEHKEIDLFLQHNINLAPPDLGIGFDCDDYAYAVKGCIGLWNLNRARIPASWCVGIIFGKFTWASGEHAANWYMNKNGVVELFEPQDHSFHPIRDCLGEVKLILL
ncbi:MAG: lectin MOA-related protein [Flavobacteriales bacterium]|nr:lectin MOA-related protein [Flavobacteriales bacterium]